MAMGNVKWARLFILSMFVVGQNMFFVDNAKAQTADHLLISEVYYDTVGDDNVEEWVEIYNPTEGIIDLSGYKLGDEETKGSGESMYQFPNGYSIKPGEQKVIAKNAMGFYALYKKYPDFEMVSTDDNVTDFSQTPDMTKYTTWAGGSFSLTNTGDEVLLLCSDDQVLDVVVFEGGSYSGTVAHPGVVTGHSIERNPIDMDTNDCSVDFRNDAVPNPGYVWVYDESAEFHAVGQMVTDVQTSGGQYIRANVATDEQGYLTYGPYRADQVDGNYQALFKLMVADNTSDQVVARIDVNDISGTGWWEYREIKGSDFTSPDSWQNFPLWFSRSGGGPLEFRVLFYDVADVSFDCVMVSPVDRLVYEAEDMWHNSGSIAHDTSFSGGRGWQALNADTNNHMIYGPYDDLSHGEYEAIFVVKVSDNTVDSNVVTFDINNIFGSDDYHRKTVFASEFAGSNQFQPFSLGFVRNDSGMMEYRAFFNGGVDVTIDNVIIIKRDTAIYEAEDLFSSTGAIVADQWASGGRIRKASTASADAGWMMFGPYTIDQTAGDYRARFNMMINENDTTEPVARLSIYNADGGGVEQNRELTGTDFFNNTTWQEFTVDFTRVNEGSMEYRVYFYDKKDISIDWVEIERL